MHGILNLKALKLLFKLPLLEDGDVSPIGITK